MFARAAFVLIALFWLTMNALLWRAEFGSRPGEGNSVPAGLVWQKILTAPDNSSLVIFRNEKRIGFCHWISGVGEQWGEIGDENLPSGMPGKIRGYELRVDASALLVEITNQVRFEGTLKLGRDREWQEFHARFSLRPVTCEVRSLAAERTVRLDVDSSGAHFERVLKFSELRNPAGLVREFLGPFAGGLLEALELPALPANAGFDPGLKWEAHEDGLWVGHTQVRVYRLKARFLDRYQVSLVVSRVGEILRVELPEGLVLANDQLAPL